MFFTLDELAETYRVHTSTILKLLLRECPEKLAVVGGRRYAAASVKQVCDDYFIIPAGWLTMHQIADDIGVSYIDVVKKMLVFPRRKEFAKHFFGGVRYHFSIIDKLKKFQTRHYIHIVNLPPEEKELFSMSEFAHVFGRESECVESWFKRGSIPERLRERHGWRYYIHRAAIEYVDGKIVDKQTRRRANKKFIDDPVDEKLIWLNGYELTPQQHADRLRIRNTHFNDVPAFVINYLEHFDE